MNDHPAPIYPGLPMSPSGPAATKLRVCIASFDFSVIGPVRNNGGVGTTRTAFTSLGKALTAAALVTKGHIALFFRPVLRNGTLDQWVAYYEKKGIQFVPMPVSCGVPITVLCTMQQSYRSLSLAA